MAENTLIEIKNIETINDLKNIVNVENKLIFQMHILGKSANGPNLLLDFSTSTSNDTFTLSSECENQISYINSLDPTFITNSIVASRCDTDS